MSGLNSRCLKGAPNASPRLRKPHLSCPFFMMWSQLNSLSSMLALIWRCAPQPFKPYHHMLLPNLNVLHRLSTMIETKMHDLAQKNVVSRVPSILLNHDSHSSPYRPQTPTLQRPSPGQGLRLTCIETHYFTFEFSIQHNNNIGATHLLYSNKEKVPNIQNCYVNRTHFLLHHLLC